GHVAEGLVGLEEAGREVADGDADRGQAEGVAQALFADPQRLGGAPALGPGGQHDDVAAARLRPAADLDKLSVGPLMQGDEGTLVRRLQGAPYPVVSLLGRVFAPLEEILVQ